MKYKELAELYDAENADHAMLREDVPFFLGQLPVRKQRILELACGTGRLAIPAAAAGHDVVGVDIEPRMITQAKRKAVAAGVGVKFVVGDVLKLKLRERFDWVVLVFNTFLAFSTLEEQDACLNAVVRHLRPAGRFYLDILQPNVELLAQEKSRGLALHSFYAPTMKAMVVKTIDVDRDVSKQLERVTFRYRWQDARGRAKQRLMKFDMTFVFPRELELLLERHGLKLERLWGNYDGSELDADSPRMIARARIGRRESR